MDINPNHEDIKNRVRDAKWLKETYQLIKRRGYKIYNNWKVSGIPSYMPFVITPVPFLSCSPIFVSIVKKFTIKTFPALGQHNGDLTTLGGTTDWCLNYCDGCIWLMYMAFVLKILHLQNLGRDFPGEWFTADLGVPVTEETLTALRQEYMRKMLEDAVRKKAERRTKAQKSEEVLSSSASPQVFDYGQMVETEKIKVNFRLGCLFVS
jgi:hypothetical protein